MPKRPVRTLIFGDIQGCFDDLQRLLDKVNYDPSQDRLGFVGDLINRGPDSLKTLRFIKALQDPLVVLGNHDLYAIAIGSGEVQYHGKHTLDRLFAAEDFPELLNWLRAQPLLHHDPELNYVMVHAGIPPQWPLTQAKRYAEELHQVLISEDYQTCLHDYEVSLKSLFGKQPTQWCDQGPEQLTGNTRMRYIINAFTRMRFCQQDGTLDMENKSAPEDCPKGFKPWFQWPSQIEADIVFGHWALLRGQTQHPQFIGLDTGCAWGEQLTCIDIQTKQHYSIECPACPTSNPTSN